jgi:hypothetical protein
MNPNQHTTEWWLARRGHITSSRMYRIVHGGWRAWTTLMNELQAELASDQPPPDQWNGGPPPAAIRWGHHWETPAINNLCLDYTIDVVRPPFVTSKRTPYIGASSDFIVIEGSVEELDFTLRANGEVKCPVVLDRHSRVIMNGQVPEEHLPQIDCQMYVHELDVTYFLSFNPHMPDPQSRLGRIIVERDPKREREMLEKCHEFHEIFQRGERPGPRNTTRTTGFPRFDI